MIFENKEYYATQYEGYFVSKEGIIVSTRRNPKGRYLAYKTDKYGYYEVLLSVNNIRYYKKVHQVVLETFSKKPFGEDITIDHINGNRTDNNLSNLQWLTRSENTSKATTGLKTKVCKHIILTLNNVVKEYFSALDMCKDLGVSIGTYNNMKRYKRLGCRNKYKLISFIETQETIEIELNFNS